MFKLQQFLSSPFKLVLILLPILFTFSGFAQTEQQVIDQYLNGDLEITSQYQKDIISNYIESNSFKQTITLNGPQNPEAIFFSEDFTGQTLPAGWSNISNIGNTQIWTFNNPGARDLTGNFDSDFAIVDSDNYGGGNSQDATLTTPSIDATGVTTVILGFDQSFRSFSGSYGLLEVSVDSVNWTVLDSLTVSTGYPNPPVYTEYDITTTAAGQASVYVRWTYVGTWGYWWAIDNVVVYEPDPTPNPAFLVNPADGATNILPSVAYMEWAPGAGTPPTGYKIFFGTDGSGTTPPTNIENGTDLGDTLIYVPSGLAFSTTYYWQIVPYNAAGDAPNPPIWSYTTGTDPTLVTPYFENFDGLTAPDLPYGWSKIVDHPISTSPRVETYTFGTPYSLPNHVRLYSNDVVDANIMLISPPVNNISSLRMKFWSKISSTTNFPPLIIGTITDPTDTATFSPLDTITTITGAYQEFTVNLDSYAGTDNYIVFKHGATPQFFRSIYIDDLLIEEIPTNPVFSVDPDSLDFGLVLPGFNSVPVTFTVKNVGVGTLEISSVTLTGTDAAEFTLIDTVNVYPVSLAAEESMTFEVYFSPTTAGIKDAFVTIVDNLTEVINDVPITGNAYTPFNAFVEDFDGVTDPNLPSGWSAIVEHTSSFAVVQTYTLTTPNSPPNHVRIYNSFTADPDGKLYLITPGVSGFSTNQLRFYAKSSSATTVPELIVGTISDPLDPLTFNPIDTISTLSTTYTEYTIDFRSYAGTDQFIAFHHGASGSGSGRSIFVDDVIWESVPLVLSIWELSVAQANLPTWFGADTERGLAYGFTSDGTEASNHRVYVASRSGGVLAVRILNAENGTDVGTLNVTGISGGAFALNDISVTSDGKIIGGNMTTNASTSPFKLYMWDNELSVPTELLSYTGTDAVRLGDKFTVVGSYAAGTMEIWAASATGTIPVVYKWTMSGGLLNPAQVITLSDAPTTLGSAAVGPIPNGDFWLNANGINPKKYQANGTLVGTVPGAIVATGSNAIRHLGFVGNNEYVATFAYGAGNHNARILEIPLGVPEDALLYAVTPSMGSLANGNGAGDVDFQVNPDFTVNVFVLGTNNGIGAYRSSDVVPVELSTFAANVVDRTVTLSWRTESESNSLGFEVERFSANQSWTQIGFVKSAGTTTEPQNYSFVDSKLETGSYSYRLKMVDLDGSFSYSKAVEVEIGTPMTFALSQNYPNPFNPATRIDYQVPFNANVQIELYSITGERVATLVNTELSAGYYTMDVDASSLRLASGVYFYRMISTDVQGSKFMDTKKMVLLK